MDSTSVYGLELLVLEGTGGKALVTDHRVIYEGFLMMVLSIMMKKQLLLESILNSSLEFKKPYPI